MISFTVLGHCPRKSNSRRIVRMGTRIASIKSKEALEYEQSFILQIPRKLKKNIECKLALTAYIYYRSRRSDLSDELFCDCLEKADIIKNDRQIAEKHLFCLVDKDNPRIEFTLDEIEDD